MKLEEKSPQVLTQMTKNVDVECQDRSSNPNLLTCV
jgi:hypothetical protein